MGDVVLLELLKARGLLPQFELRVDAFCLIEDESLRADSLKLVHDLRSGGFTVEYSLVPAKPDKQFKRALEMNALRIIKLERDASGAPTVRLKNLRDRTEKTLPLEQASGAFSPGQNN